MTLPGILRVTVQDTAGNAVSGAAVTFRQSQVSAATKVFSDSLGLNPTTTSFVSDARGQVQAYGFGEYFADVSGSGLSISTLRLMAEGEGSITPMRFGAVGDGVEDDILAIDLAISVASTIALGGAIEIDGGGRTYAVSRTVFLKDTPGVTLSNFKIIRHPDWSLSGSAYMVDIGNGGNKVGNYNIGLRNVEVDGDRQQPGIIVRPSVDGLIFHCRSVHWTTYGLRIFNPGGSGEWRVIGGQFHKWFFGDPENEDWSQRAGTAISVEMADCLINDVLANYCETPLFIDTGGCHINGGHFYNGNAEPPRTLLASYGSNGAGALRIVTTTGHNLTNGELGLLPWMPEISPSVAGGNRRAWAATVINTTTVDFLDYPWSGATYAPATDLYLLAYADEPVCARVAATASGVNFCGTQFDNGKLVIEGGSAGVIANGARWIKSAKGYNVCDVELVTDRVGEDWAGVHISGCQMNASTPVRFVTNSPGTLASTLKCVIVNNTTANGRVVSAVGQLSFPGGSKSSPGLIPGGAGDAPDSFIAVTGAGIFSADGETGISSDNKARVVANDDRALFGDGEEAANQFAEVRSVSTQSAKFGAGTWALGTYTPRWRWGLEASTNWTLAAHDAAGLFVANDIVVENATGLVTLGATARSGVRVGFRTDVQMTAPSAGGGAALPATPAGYAQIEINGTVRRIAYY